jgi:cell wall-associated NlpC family hydrolase
MIFSPAQPPQPLLEAALEATRIPVAHRGRGPDGLDCAGMVKFVLISMGTAVPLPEDYPLAWFHTDPGYMRRWVEETLRWPRTAAVDPGDVLLLRLLTLEGDHAGVYLGGGRFLHGLNGRFVIESLEERFGRVTWASRIAAAYRPQEHRCPQQSPSSPAPPSGRSLLPSGPRSLASPSPR